MAVGTGFGQLFRGIGQVGGVAISSALFQSILARELHARIRTPDAEEVRKASHFCLRSCLQELANAHCTLSHLNLR